MCTTWTAIGLKLSLETNTHKIYDSFSSNAAAWLRCLRKFLSNLHVICTFYLPFPLFHIGKHPSNLCCTVFCIVDNSFVEAHIKGTPEVRKGKNYINYHSVELKIVWGQAHMQFDDIFKGNSELTKQTNQIINDNAAMVLEEIRPAAEQTISAIVLSLIKGIADRFSLQDLFVYWWLVNKVYLPVYQFSLN